MTTKKKPTTSTDGLTESDRKALEALLKRCLPTVQRQGLFGGEFATFLDVRERVRARLHPENPQDLLAEATPIVDRMEAHVERNRIHTEKREAEAAERAEEGRKRARERADQIAEIEKMRELARREARTRDECKGQKAPRLGG